MRRAAPGLPSRQVEDAAGLQARHVRRPGEQRPYLVVQTVWSVPVVVVPLSDELALSERAGLVPLATDRGAMGQTQIPDPRPFRDEVGDGLPPVVHNDQLPVGVALAREVVQRL